MINRLESLSVFFPCHNEEGSIEALTWRTLDVLEKIADDFEVIIVNDGSQDETAVIADQLAEKDNRVRVVHHETNKGYGGALQSGFKAASKQWVFYTDGDAQFDIADIIQLIPLTEQYDIVTCYRLNRQDSWLRKLNGHAWNWLVNQIFGLHLKDIDCAFKLYRREIFDRITMKSMGALIDTEILARAARAGYRMTQLGVKHYPRQTGQSSGANPAVILRAFKELFKLKRDIQLSPRQ